ncbi:hypothetical protein [Crocosphaera watsonii]|nr:hypothetical protein [Crocosphaera watsonii]CCQ54825.1 hypothetical protein CWATWH0005_3094 [Crocosphaera watsonii WH 0005]CCQ61841.1 hypothetical protein CWATWH0401_1072 [Crocosphaera watsonii WH 0401]CCQ70022.1 hypothetical protein CWATWH0402_5641 [Crocosphaera watsonii WH 0402]
MIELIKTRRDIFHEIIIEALEEVGLANAITEGRKNDFVPQENIFSLLDEEPK